VIHFHIGSSFVRRVVAAHAAVSKGVLSRSAAPSARVVPRLHAIVNFAQKEEES
jgi:hypothetical protein